jgi:hypothetical protein
MIFLFRFHDKVSGRIVEIPVQGRSDCCEVQLVDAETNKAHTVVQINDDRVSIVDHPTSKGLGALTFDDLRAEALSDS